MIGEGKMDSTMAATDASSLLDKTIRLASQIDSTSTASSTSSSTVSSTVSSTAPVTAMAIFQTGIILNESKKHSMKEWYKLSDAFYNLLVQYHIHPSDHTYLHTVLFADLKLAFHSILKSDTNSIRSNITSNSYCGGVGGVGGIGGIGGGGIGGVGRANLLSQKLFCNLSSSISAMCGIYDALWYAQSSQKKQSKTNGCCLMEYAFDVNVCNHLVLLYDVLDEVLEVLDRITSNHNTARGKRSTTTDTYTDTNTGTNTGTINDADTNGVEKERCNIHELKDCILSALSSLLLHGLIYPSTTTTATTTTKLATSKNVNAKTSSSTTEDDHIQNIMHIIQGMNEQSSSANTTSFCLGDLLLWQQKKQQQRQRQRHQQQQHENDEQQHSSIATIIPNLFSDQVAPQKEYLISILNSSIQQSTQHHTNTNTNTNANTNTKKTNTPKQNTKNNYKKQSAMDRNISQIKSIFPHLGEGYIETALACYNHDLEQTTIILMESENGNTQTLHPRLKAMDKSLPARKKNSKEEYVQFGAGKKNGKDQTRNDQEEEEARNIQKEHIQSIIQKQEEEAYNLGIAIATANTDTDTNTNTDINTNDMEYNDDYDDQYDAVDGMGVGGTTANADSGLYDIDYDAIKTYNKVTKEMEADRLFWEESQNDNRRSSGKSGTSGHQKKKANKNINDGIDNDDGSDNDDGNQEVDGQKKYRGPDKGKGGRLIGPDGKYLPFTKSRKKGGGNPKGNNQNSKNGDNNAGNGEKQKEGSNNNKDGKKNDNLTKIQKRRKNDNKAKIGNHHRKERALKKSGM